MTADTSSSLETQSGPSLSIYIAAHNEAKNLRDILPQLVFADEVIVLLDKCTDESASVVESCHHSHKHVRSVKGSWDLEADRRNAALDICRGDWILELDADERVSKELAVEIREIIRNSVHQLHCIPYDNYIGDRLVKYGWGAYMGVSQKIALFQKGAKRYKGTRPIHADLDVHGDFGKTLETPVTHLMDADFSDTLRRFDRYTALRAQELNDENITESFGKNFTRIFSRFYKSYVRRHGYREGALGFVIGMLAGLYPMVSWVRAKYRF